MDEKYGIGESFAVYGLLTVSLFACAKQIFGQPGHGACTV